MKRLFWLFLFPGGVVISMFIGLSYSQPDAVKMTRLWEGLALAIFVIGVFSGIRYQRARLIFVLLLLSVYAGLLQFVPAGNVTQFVLLVSGVMLPLNFSWVATLKEHRLTSMVGVLFPAFMAAQFAALVWLGRTYMAETLELLGKEWLVLPWAIPDVLTQVGWAVLILCGMMVIWRALIKPSTFDGAMCWAYFAMGISLVRPEEAMFWLASAGLALSMATLMSRHFVSYSDEVTGLPGEKALHEYLASLGTYTLVVAEIDNLKEINSHYGKKTGDQVLRMVAGRLGQFEYSGKVFRNYGLGFTMVYPGRRLPFLVPSLDLLRLSIASHPFLLRRPGRPKKKPDASDVEKEKRNVKSIQITVSLGGAERFEDARGSESTINVAYEMLEKAKLLGKNRICA